MAKGPHQKVSFSRRDITALHDLPSAQCEDPIIVNAHRGGRSGGWVKAHIKAVAFLVILFLVVFGAILIALDRGLVDGVIEDRARSALAGALGETYTSEIGGAGVRMTSRGQVALIANNVKIRPADGTGGEYAVNRLRLLLDPLAMMGGSLKVNSIEVEGAHLIAGSGPGIGFSDLAHFRVDSLDERIEQAFEAVDRVGSVLANRGTETIVLENIRLGDDLRGITVKRAELTGQEEDEFDIDATLSFKSRDFGFAVHATKGDRDDLSQLEATVTGLPVDYTSDGLERRATGLETLVDIGLSATRATPGGVPELQLTIDGEPGSMMLGGVSAELRELKTAMSYQAEQKKIEIMPSLLQIGDTKLPFNGGLIDIDNVPERTDINRDYPGMAFDLVIANGLAAPGDSADSPVKFDARAFGRIMPNRNRIVADQLALVTGRYNMAASLSLQFVEGISPAITLYAQTDRLPTTAVKQLWPYWMGKRARQWVLENLYGGTVSNGRIQLSAPAGHFPPGKRAPPFTENQFQIEFDIERARMNVAGDIPPLRDANGHLSLRGTKVEVSVSSAGGYFPTGRVVKVSDGTLTIPDTEEKPLMADLSLSVSGAADAVAELITYHPIDVLDRIGFKPEELSGEISSQVRARFGLVREQDPPPTEWEVNMDLAGVDIGKQVEGRTFSDIEGKLNVTPARAHLTADATVDGIPLTLDLTEPVSNSGVERKRLISGTLDDTQREKIAPGTGLLLSGPVGLKLEEKGAGKNAITLKLDRATLTVPGIGWKKGAGIPGTASFDIESEGNSHKLRHLVVSGDGFKVTGNIDIADGSFSSARLDSIRLSPGDDYRADITHRNKAYDIKVSGASADLRQLISEAKSNVAATDGGGGENFVIAASGSLGQVRGFYETSLSDARFSYAGRNGRTEKLSFKAVSPSGQAVVIDVDGQSQSGQEKVEMTSGDAGAFARFAGVYGKMQGGLLNVRLQRAGDGPRRGVVDIRNFKIVGEEKLKALVSSPADSQGRSLNDAVRRNIDVTEASFEVANARIESGRGYLNLDEGILRGTEIGAAFRGLVYDQNGNMDLAGTFMPAYGINRLFGELPLIGAILGNGRDQGLLGITFRLVGDADSPQVVINPLSLIAPGVFRNIFEFR
ncbi:hypothetical protein E2A64_08250 [Pseudohoeflea suaedae]|uniref:YhdP central domain-containing protein n=1 Tax=Pseudohoeflea suaedae TaxID=877384 RepID=A0A4R5PQS6_9HYPH|nr:DUF3971 domain-containing protein [Pseudohoeflea suaedae]TDH39061.1 hypothetical protein E2A64_08250 [Pseudohoeflea suaedae]